MQFWIDLITTVFLYVSYGKPNYDYLSLIYLIKIGDLNALFNKLDENFSLHKNIPIIY